MFPIVLSQSRSVLVDSVISTQALELRLGSNRPLLAFSPRRTENELWPAVNNPDEPHRVAGDRFDFHSTVMLHAAEPREANALLGPLGAQPYGLFEIALWNGVLSVMADHGHLSSFLTPIALQLHWHTLTKALL